MQREAREVPPHPQDGCCEQNKEKQPRGRGDGNPGCCWQTGRAEQMGVAAVENSGSSSEGQRGATQ